MVTQIVRSNSKIAFKIYLFLLCCQAYQYKTWISILMFIVVGQLIKTNQILKRQNHVRDEKVRYSIHEISMKNFF